MPCRAPTALAFVTSALDLTYISIDDNAVDLYMTVPLRHASLNSISAAAIAPVSSTSLTVAVVGGHPDQLFIFDIAIDWTNRGSLISSFVASLPTEASVASMSICPFSRTTFNLAQSTGGVKQFTRSALGSHTLTVGKSALFDGETVFSPSGALACAISDSNIVVVNLFVLQL